LKLSFCASFLKMCSFDIGPMSFSLRKRGLGH
jgi:hypothetical protein